MMDNDCAGMLIVDAPLSPLPVPLLPVPVLYAIAAETSGIGFGAWAMMKRVTKHIRRYGVNLRPNTFPPKKRIVRA